MGLSSSQARLLHLTARMHQIEYKAARLEAQKLQLANDSNDVYDEYLAELDKTKIQYRYLNENGSTTFADATLSTLLDPSMRPQLFLRNAETGAVYITEEYANRMGIDIADAAPYTGTLEDFLIENGATKTTITTTKPYTETLDEFLTNNGAPKTTILESERTYQSQTPVTEVNTTLKKVTCTALSESDLLESGKTYTVSTAAELKRLSEIINNGGDTSGVNIVLANDINMTGQSFNSISEFKGTFDGNGKTINGLNNTLFTKLTNAEVTNLKLNNSTVNSSSVYTGTLADSATGSSISNISVTSSNITSSASTTGGLIGIASDSSISRCSFSGTIAGSEIVGGLVGSTSGTTTIDNCSTNATISGLKNTGGMIGYANGGTITNCSSNANITVNADSITSNPDSGGFVGVARNVTIENCVAKGTLNDLTSNKSSVSSGFLGCTGSTSTVTIKNSDTYVDVNTDKPIATGFGSSYSGSTLILEHCNVYGSVNSIQGSEYAIAYTESSSFGNYTDCYYDSSNGILLVGNLGTNVNHSNITSMTPFTNTILTLAPNLTSSTVATGAIAIADLGMYEVHEEIYKEDFDYTHADTQALVNRYYAGEEITEEAFDFNDPTIKELVAQYEIKKAGFIVEDTNFIDGYENSSEWLTNMILTGTAILSRLETDRNGNSSYVDTSVATETALREVQDENNLKKAEAKYEAAMKQIDKKDRRYDTELARFEAERNATKTEIETLKTVAKENTDRTFKLFS